MQDSFGWAFAKLMEHEGGYSNVRDDPGGETIWGITRRSHPEMWSSGRPTKEAAKEFYRREYWDELRCGEIVDRRIAFELFDTAVNMGVYHSASMLQAAYNFLVGDGVEMLAVDGKIGPRTLGAVNALTQKSESHSQSLYLLQNILQGGRYLKLVTANPNLKQFLRGWVTKRVQLLTDKPGAPDESYDSGSTEGQEYSDNE